MKRALDATKIPTAAAVAALAPWDVRRRRRGAQSW